jgi:hypothetical protein
MGLLDDAIKDHLELKRRHGADASEVARLEHEALGPARREPAAAVAPAPDESALVDQDDFEDDPLLDDEVLVDEDEAHAPLLDDEDDGYDDEVTADERLDAPLHRAQGAPPPPEPAAPAEQDAPAAESSVDQPTQQFSLRELEDAAEAEAAAPSDLEDATDAPAEAGGAAEVSSEPAPAAPSDATPAAPPEAAPPAPAASPAPADDEPEPHADVVPADEEPDPDDVLEETPEFLQETPEHDRLWFEQKPPRDFDF